jgi:hypothetical protein
MKPLNFDSHSRLACGISFQRGSKIRITGTPFQSPTNRNCN